MYAITGITGKVGGEVARHLLAANQPVRALLRDPQKAPPWKDQGCEIAIADMSDAPALTRAFANAEAVFILLPPIFDPAPDFPETRATVAALRTALAAAKPQHIVCISTIGAQAAQPNLLTQLAMMEQSLRELPTPITFLRPAWFMENFAWDLPSAKQNGIIDSYLQPLDRPIPMVATADIGRLAAELLRDHWTGPRIVQLEGPDPISPLTAAATLSELLHKPIRAQAVPRNTWDALFRAQGMKNPAPRIAMLDGFNEGWITFENPPTLRKGTTPLKTVLTTLLR